MFCKNCGKEIKEGEKFCANCGVQVSTVLQTLPAQTILNEITENTSSQNKEMTIGIKVINGVIVLFLVVILIASVLGSGDGNNTDLMFASLVEQGGNSTSRLKRIKHLKNSGDVTLSGELPKMESIQIENGCLILEQGTICPNVTSIQCRSIVTKDYQDDISSFELTAFPALQSVTISAKNSQIDRDALRTIETVILLRDNGMLQELHLNVTHTIEDLYGKWVEESGKLAFTLKKDGSVRISEGSGLIGANLLKFKEVDNDTLRLKVEGSIWLELISLDMDYVLLGDRLTVTLAGKEYVLYRD